MMSIMESPVEADHVTSIRRRTETGTSAAFRSWNRRPRRRNRSRWVKSESSTAVELSGSLMPKRPRRSRMAARPRSMWPLTQYW
jgi:hypothetical protein